MQTKSVMVYTLCVPCGCRCRYCLLSWDGRTVGADYDRSQRFAERFHDWILRERPELKFDFSFGYCMEHPKLLDAVEFLNSIGSVTGRFIQCDGMAFRKDRELDELLLGLKEHGVEAFNFTFYGTKTYHDRFAGRQGDYTNLLRMLETGDRLGFTISVGIPLTKENVGQAQDLLADLERKGVEDIRFIIPHGEGRGARLENIRLCSADLDRVSEKIRNKLNRRVYKTEAEWCKIEGGEPEKNRALLISLTNENIDRLENTPFSEIIAETEALDDAYYAAFPSFKELLRRYGDKEGDRLYSRRDLFRRCRKQYEAEYGVRVYDVTDERYTGSRRY